MDRATAIIHAGPALGAKFVEYTVEMEAGGQLGPTSAQRFFYVCSGRVLLGGSLIEAGGFGFVPHQDSAQIKAAVESRVLVVEKPLQPATVGQPKGFIGNISAVKPQPLMGDEGVLVQTLLPDSPEFDFAVNLMTFAPGAALSLVECHIMEHGLLMLEGGGIYRLGDHWYPTMAGDFIWMAPYCPQWFGAIGKVPAKYLIYKDWNRHPL